MGNGERDQGGGKESLRRERSWEEGKEGGGMRDIGVGVEGEGLGIGKLYSGRAKITLLKSGTLSKLEKEKPLMGSGQKFPLPSMDFFRTRKERFQRNL